MLITMRGLIAGPALAAVLAVTPASTVIAAPGAAVKSGFLQGYLSEVACPRASECWAVGSQQAAGVRGVYSVLIERWNGSRWRVAASPGAALKDSSLSAVSCASTSSCWAVGAAALGARDEPIAEHWNGRTWSLTVLAEPAGTKSAALVGVSCPTAGRCWAAGAINPDNPNIAKPLVEHWAGERWSVVRAAPAAGTVLNAVSCRRDASCWAVGLRAARPPAEHWNGTRWSLVATPQTGGGLNGVSCPGTDCVAVGETFSIGKNNSFAVAAVAERWNGSRWSVMHAPQPAGKAATLLNGVSCITSSDCFAVGFSVRPHFWATLIEHMQGSTWVIVESPNPAGAGLAILGGVACTSARACWAVGARQKTPGAITSPERTLAERWNGTRWSIAPTP